MTTGSSGSFHAQVRTCTYRFRREDRSLVYVGVTDDLESRLRAHSRKPWWPEVVSTEVVWFDDRLSALYEETRAIDNENPTYNDRPGISPFGLRPVVVRSQRTTTLSRAPVAATRHDKDDLVLRVKQGQAHAEILQFGEPTGNFLVSLKWYESAKQRLGEPLDWDTIPRVELA